MTEDGALKELINFYHKKLFQSNLCFVIWKN